MSNSYKSSSGEYIKKSVIDSRVRKTKEQIINNQLEEHGFNFCEKCKRSVGVRLDCSHKISVDECQKSGRSELAYDIDNIEILCRKHHIEHENNRNK